MPNHRFQPTGRSRPSAEARRWALWRLSVHKYVAATLYFIASMSYATDIASVDPYPGSGGLFLGTPNSAAIQSGHLDFNSATFSTFVIGVTTKQEVAHVLGTPAGWSTKADGTSQMEYDYVGSKTSLGMREVIHAFFNFDSNRVLREMTYPGQRITGVTDIPLRGTSGGSQESIAKVERQLVPQAMSTLDCQKIDYIEVTYSHLGVTPEQARALPPSSPLYQMADKTTHEKWEVHGCQKVAQFGVGFFRSIAGGGDDASFKAIK